jgi:hypothetical protein
MYKCQVTGKQSREGEKLNKIVVETREKQYKHWDREAEEEWFTQGVEIAREVNACADGVAMWEAWSPEEKEDFRKRLAGQ